MKSISFKNFRRFPDFPEFKFGNITILVGGNNSGKTTMEKALLLVLDNLRSLRLKRNATPSPLGFFNPQFRFDAHEYHDLKLGTFERSLYNDASEDKMEFTLCVDGFYIRLVVVPDSDKLQPIAKVSLIEVNDIRRHMRYTFNFATCSTHVEVEKVKGNGVPRFNEIQTRIAELHEILKTDVAPEKAARANAELEKLLTEREGYVDTAEDARESSTIEFEMRNLLDNKGERRVTYSVLPGYIENIEAYAEEFCGENQEIAQVLGDNLSLIMESACALESELSKIKLFYIQAHGINQKVLYSINDKNDFMAQAIHGFARCAVEPGEEADIFLRKWMKEFEIGENYKITSIDGEGYTVKICTGNENMVNLSDLGMGANQLMVLLFRLATIMHENGYVGSNELLKKVNAVFKRKYGSLPNTKCINIIIEEPEQNLHPRLQSKLADFFAEVSKDESYQFLVETHSEYLIRRSQVLVSEMNLSEEELEKQNPFKVYYFPEGGVPYDMRYTPTGRFINNFGDGFFDESVKWHLQIIRNEKSRK